MLDWFSTSVATSQLLASLSVRPGCSRHMVLEVSTLPVASSYFTDSSLSLADIIRNSQTAKARLLHYFPPSPDAPLPKEDEPIDSWCGFHLDHSLLTGLCSVSMTLS